MRAHRRCMRVELPRQLCGWRRSTEDVDSTGKEGGVVGLVAVDPGGRAGFAIRTDRQRVSGQRDRSPEAVSGSGIGGLELGLPGPRAALANEHVDRTGRAGGVVGLVAVDPGYPPTKHTATWLSLFAADPIIPPPHATRARRRTSHVNTATARDYPAPPGGSLDPGDPGGTGRRERRPTAASSQPIRNRSGSVPRYTTRSFAPPCEPEHHHAEVVCGRDRLGERSGDAHQPTSSPSYAVSSLRGESTGR